MSASQVAPNCRMSCPDGIRLAPEVPNAEALAVSSILVTVRPSGGSIQLLKREQQLDAPENKRAKRERQSCDGGRGPGAPAPVLDLAIE